MLHRIFFNGLSTLQVSSVQLSFLLKWGPCAAPITWHQYFPRQTRTLCPPGQFGILCHTGGSRFSCADQTAGSPVKDHTDRQTVLQSHSSCAHQVFFLSPEALQISGVRFLFSLITKTLCTLAAGDTRLILPESRFPSLRKFLKTLLPP